jgi:hypothetical protein
MNKATTKGETEMSKKTTDWGHITEFIARAEDEDGCDVFVALTDCGSVRVGYVGGPIKAYTKEHTLYDALVGSVNLDMNAEEIEEVFENLGV